MLGTGLLFYTKGLFIMASDNIKGMKNHTKYEYNLVVTVKISQYPVGVNPFVSLALRGCIQLIVYAVVEIIYLEILEMICLSY